MKQVKVAVLGGGWFGPFHVDNLHKMEGVEVVALATSRPKALEEFAKKAPSARTYLDHASLIKAESGLDALIACVPPDQHGDLELLAARHGVNLYMEKPLGVSLEEVRKAERAIKDSGIICSVGYQTRYNPILDQMKDCISRNKVGLVTATWLGTMPPTPWWRVKARSGGQLAEQFTHVIDVLRYLFGDVKTVYSSARKGLITGVPNYDVEDCSASVFTFESGLLANLSCGCFLDGSKVDSKVGFEIFMDGAKAEYSWDTCASWGSRQMSSVARFGNDFHYPALHTFIEAVRSKDPSKIRSSYPDAVKTFRSTYAANLSMESHREVRLDEV